MASPCEVHVDEADRDTAQHIVALAAGEAARIEEKLSRYRRGNAIDAINTSGGRTVVVDDETARLLDYGARLHELSDGKFDVTSGVLRRAWRFDGSDRVPSREAVAALLPVVGWDKVRWRAPELTLLPGMEIESWSTAGGTNKPPNGPVPLRAFATSVSASAGGAKTAATANQGWSLSNN